MKNEEIALMFAKECIGWKDAKRILIEYTDAIVIKHGVGHYFHCSNLTDIMREAAAFLARQDRTLVITYRKEPDVEGKPFDWTVQIDGEFEVESDDLGGALMLCCLHTLGLPQQKISKEKGYYHNEKV